MQQLFPPSGFSRGRGMEDAHNEWTTHNVVYVYIDRVSTDLLLMNSLCPRMRYVLLNSVWEIIFKHMCTWLSIHSRSFRGNIDEHDYIAKESHFGGLKFSPRSQAKSVMNIVNLLHQKKILLKWVKHEFIFCNKQIKRYEPRILTERILENYASILIFFYYLHVCIIYHGAIL